MPQRPSNEEFIQSPAYYPQQEQAYGGYPQDHTAPPPTYGYFKTSQEQDYGRPEYPSQESTAYSRPDYGPDSFGRYDVEPLNADLQPFPEAIEESYVRNAKKTTAHAGVGSYDQAIYKPQSALRDEFVRGPSYEGDYDHAWQESRAYSEDYSHLRPAEQRDHYSNPPPQSHQWKPQYERHPEPEMRQPEYGSMRSQSRPESHSDWGYDQGRSYQEPIYEQPRNEWHAPPRPGLQAQPSTDWRQAKPAWQDSGAFQETPEAYNRDPRGMPPPRSSEGAGYQGGQSRGKWDTWDD